MFKSPVPVRSVNDSVFRFRAPVKVRLEREPAPADMFPARTVEVPDTEEVMLPPERVMPLEEETPAVLTAPVSTVEVPETVEYIFPPERVNPLVDERP